MKQKPNKSQAGSACLTQPVRRASVRQCPCSAYVCDRWSGEDSPASNEDGTPAIVEGDEVIVRETRTDEYGQHFSTGRYPIDGERFYWSAPNATSAATEGQNL